jgi:hypothetical protein
VADAVIEAEKNGWTSNAPICSPIGICLSNIT